GLTLIPQAGVAIGMARLSQTALPEYGSVINAVILSGTLIYELLGPVITKIALTKAGEIRAEKA
ncbi:MAG: cation:proton antiporter, partial [Clostridia bacterium]|nr:cation:proton antiporter [Clostridia bacterium]